MASLSLPGLYEISSVLKSILASSFLAATLTGGVGPSFVLATETNASIGATCPNPAKPVHEQLQPLSNLIAKGEGDYNSVNRGYAGDTPGGIQRLTGREFSTYTVQQVMEFQHRWLYAVGRYQFIPKTLRFAVAMSSVSGSDLFTPETQDKLMAALVFYKRPSVGAYLRGDHDNLAWALNDMAKEWASIEYRNGRGFYDHIGGNRAHITRAELTKVLQQIKKDWYS